MVHQLRRPIMVLDTFFLTDQTLLQYSSSTRVLIAWLRPLFLRLPDLPLLLIYCSISISMYKRSGRGGLSAPPSSVEGNALLVIDDGIESVNVKNRYQGARVSARRVNREPEDGIRWKFVHGRVVVVR